MGYRLNLIPQIIVMLSMVAWINVSCNQDRPAPKQNANQDEQEKQGKHEDGRNPVILDEEPPPTGSSSKAEGTVPEVGPEVVPESATPSLAQDNKLKPIQISTAAGLITINWDGASDVNHDSTVKFVP